MGVNKMKKGRSEMIVASVVVVVVLAVIGIAFLSSHSNQQSTTQTKQTLSKKELNKQPLPQLSNAVHKNETVVEIKTTVGNVKVKLFNKYAPLAVKNFVKHAETGYYNNTIFHRVINDFMIQGGDPTGTGIGGSSIWKNKNSKIDSGSGFKNEISASLYNIRGALSMANAGADTNGSQFFINQNHENVASQLKKKNYPDKIIKAYQKGGNPSLDGNYTVFGQVISGMDVVDKIASAEVKDNADGSEKSAPVNPVKILSTTVIKK
ncbi:peptidyl-prolyl cis-trans isomerase, cyclophilin-type [Weissella paramesenteroides ATCC 33313]|uniref:Peptidyl-prolyl cis-trans isomerase n=2 Tax=Weissella paramesenteroides TaxID=1249 RepID=C5R7V3_WEIPA|nr:peptidyl-prolyl cis-trans isomerase, cyclophilin-type [Weissella paramesenteroides ATCC 33313]